MNEIINGIKVTFEQKGYAITDIQYCPDDNCFVIEGIALECVFYRKIYVQFLVGTWQ